MNEYFGEDNYKDFVQPFQNPSLFHDFIRWTIYMVSYEDMTKVEIDDIRKGRKLWVDIAIKHYEIDDNNFESFLKENSKSLLTADDDDIYYYFQDLRLCQVYDDLLDKMSEEIFFILFLNRKLLQRFNDLVASKISEHIISDEDENDDEGLDAYFAQDGVLKRVTIPVWVQRAVLHRDRGMCTNCNKDVSGLVSIGAIENFDHIIPLAAGGINDVSNIQLLCQTCNKSKGKKTLTTSSKYEKWF